MYDAQPNGGADFADTAGLSTGFRDSAGFPAHRRGEAGLQAILLVSMLDEIDYGMAVVGADGRILLANELAQLEFGANRFVRRRQDRFTPSLAQHAAQMDIALENARRGQRSLLVLGDDDEHLALSIVPLASCGQSVAQLPDTPLALVIFGRRDACQALTLLHFGRLHGLTGAEQALLPAIIRGLSVEAIARQQYVSVTTVRTQLGSIRAKTGVKSLRALAARLASLPPIRPMFKLASAH